MCQAGSAVYDTFQLFYNNRPLALVINHCCHGSGGVHAETRSSSILDVALWYCVAMSNWTKSIKSLCKTDQNQSNHCVQLNKTNKITVYNWTKPIKSLCTTEQTNQITVYNWTKPIKSLCTTEQNQSEASREVPIRYVSLGTTPYKYIEV